MDRYNIYVEGETQECDLEVVPNPNGEWVKYTDVEALQARVMELEGLVGLMKAKIHNDATNAKSATQITTDTKGTP